MGTNKSDEGFGRYCRAIKNRFSRDGYPKNLIWFVTERCNLKCPHCFVNSSAHEKRREIPVERAVDFIKNSGLSHISFTGGEPSLYPGIEKLIAAALERGIGVGLSSNGYRNQPLLKSLKEIGKPIYIQVSLDGDRETHNKIRGDAGAFDDALEFLSAARSQGHRVVVVFTVSSKNIATLKSVLQLCSRERWPIYINFIRSSDQVKAHAGNTFIPDQKNDLSIEQMEYCYRLWHEHVFRYMPRLDRLVMVSKTEQVIHFIKHGVWSYKCAAGINDAVMYPNGDVALCETLQPIGSMEDYDWDWKRFWRNRREKLKTCFCQWDCAMIYSLTHSLTGLRFFVKYFIR